MGEFILAAPGDLATPTGGYLYDARILRELQARGHAARALALPDDLYSPPRRASQKARYSG
ncbi:glycosyltransferase family 1 protein, partial [Hansschlegelia beijingensis]